MKRDKQLSPHHLAVFIAIFALCTAVQADQGMQIIADGQTFDSIKEYRKYRNEQERLKILAEQEAEKAKKEAEEALPPLRGDNPFIAVAPDESEWKTVIIDPDPNEQHGKKISAVSVEGQIDDIASSFTNSVEGVENNKVTRDNLSEALQEVAGDNDNAVLLMSQEEKLRLYQYEDPVMASEQPVVEPQTSLDISEHLPTPEPTVPTEPAVEHDAIYKELYLAQ